MNRDTAALILISLALCVPLAAQSPQPFLAPPKLQTASAAGVVQNLAAIISATGCNPAGDINQVGNVISVDLVVRKDANSIFNPSTGIMDRVSLRSYGGCLTGPLLDVHPGTNCESTLPITS
jgi:hypothetical protein